MSWFMHLLEKGHYRQKFKSTLQEQGTLIHRNTRNKKNHCTKNIFYSVASKTETTKDVKQGYKVTAKSNQSMFNMKGWFLLMFITIYD